MTTAKRPSGETGADEAKPARAAGKRASQPAPKPVAKPAAKAAKPAKAKVPAARGGKAVNGDKPAYSAPALEKGLDVLELLATLSEGVTPSQIAQQLGFSETSAFTRAFRLHQRLSPRAYRRHAVAS